MVRCALLRTKTTLDAKVKLRLMADQLSIQSEIVQRRDRKKKLAKALRKRYGVGIARIEVEKYTEGELLLFAKARWRKRLAKEYGSRWLDWYRRRKQERVLHPPAAPPSVVTQSSPLCPSPVDERTSAATTIQRVYRGYKDRLRVEKIRCFHNIHKLRVLFPYERKLQREEEARKTLEAWAQRVAKGCKVKKIDIQTVEEYHEEKKERKIEAAKSAYTKPTRYPSKPTQSKSPLGVRRGSVSPMLKQTKDTSELLQKNGTVLKKEAPPTTLPTLSPLAPSVWPGLFNRKGARESGQTA